MNTYLSYVLALLSVGLSSFAILACEIHPASGVTDILHEGENIVDYSRMVQLERRKDLQGDIDSDRPLSLHDLNLLLALSSFLIDRDNSFVDRERAARDLGHFGHSYGVPALLAVLRDERDRFGVRQRAAIALSMIRDEHVVRYLIEDGLGSTNEGLVQTTLWNLSQFVGGPPALRNPSHVSQLKPPPKDASELDEYLGVWLEWWDEVKDSTDLNRALRGNY